MPNVKTVIKVAKIEVPIYVAKPPSKYEFSFFSSLSHKLYYNKNKWPGKQNEDEISIFIHYWFEICYLCNSNLALDIL